MILGIDEAGRGPWAGPLVVGAVVLGGIEIEGLTDSKKLSKKKRELLYGQVTAQAVAYASGWVTATELDALGMSAALRLATRRAVEQITVPYSEIIIDGTINFLADTGKGKYVQTMPKADLLIPSVSAASIIAKVERDRYMAVCDDKYPGYHFGSHTGYGVAKHRAAIEELGITPEHRLSFAPLAKYAVSIHANSETASARRDSGSFTSRALAGLASLKQSSALQEVLSSEPRACADVSGFTRIETPTTKAIGDEAEKIVAEYLSMQGHIILERNWRTKICEIDIISQANDTIYFTEVKYRNTASFGGGVAAITAKKLKQMTFAARVYAKAAKLQDVNLRLAVADVAGVPPHIREFLELQ